MPTITPFLWFDSQAEEAMNLYTSIFTRSKVVSVNRAQGRVVSVAFDLEGQRFMGLNGGPLYRFNESVSFFVGCETQQEIDELWTKLIDGGGAPSRCGWLKDRYGLSWQIVPNSLGRMIGDRGRCEIAARRRHDDEDGQTGCEGAAARIRRRLVPSAFRLRPDAAIPDRDFLCGLRADAPGPARVSEEIVRLAKPVGRSALRPRRDA